MRALVLSSVRHNRSRYVATLLAIVTGVAFFAATGFVADRVIASLEGDAQRQYGNVDVAVVARSVSDSTLGSAAENLKIPGTTASRIAALPGVTAVGGELTGAIGFVGRNGKPFATNAVGRLWIDDAQLNPLDLAQGRAPRATDEIVVDRGLAKDRNLKVGQTIPTLTLAGRYPARIVGITRFGSSDSIDQNGTVSLPAARAFAALNSGKRQYDELYVRGSGSQEALRARVAGLVPPAFEAQTGAKLLKDKRDSIGAVGRYLRNGLQAFAILALLVGGFVIYNTFSVIVAQRLRELAVLSAIGATPKQIKRMLRWEGIVIGLPGTIALNGSLPAAKLGRMVTVATADGRARRLKVVAVLDRNSIDAAQLGSYVDRATFRSVVGPKAPTVAFMDVKDGARSATKDAINDLADTRPDVTATEGNTLGRLLGTVFDFLIRAVDGLLMMSVVIALTGIVNTLSLAIIERRRELGLLRVIGMTDRLVRRTVSIESLLIAALGTLTGVVLGLLTGWALIHAIDRLSDASLTFSVPYGTIALVLVLGVVLGVLASLLPSRRSTHLDVLDALQTT